MGSEMVVAGAIVDSWFESARTAVAWCSPWYCRWRPGKGRKIWSLSRPSRRWFRIEAGWRT